MESECFLVISFWWWCLNEMGRIQYGRRIGKYLRKSNRVNKSDRNWSPPLISAELSGVRREKFHSFYLNNGVLVLSTRKTLRADYKSWADDKKFSYLFFILRFSRSGNLFTFINFSIRNIKSAPFSKDVFRSLINSGLFVCVNVIPSV